MAENEEENDQQFDENNEQNEQNESASTDFSGVHSRNTDEPEDSSIIPVSGLYENWFLDYASYVILERAVPSVHDGFKPVQRRILHSMKEMDDGRYNKVANIIGNTMKYHPHGDASIGDALVQLGQKDLLIDCQGNWGNTLTGDGAAAPRYIEARLTKFANHVVFNPKTTNWLKSYDGRNNEPEQLPVKFPLLLAQGAEGIAVGMACKILPHNFIELIDQSINHLRGKRVEIYPDFPNGGMADFSNYNDGLRGGKVRLRAKIKKEDSKTLIINEIPVGTTTSLIDSILKANDKGKIKIKKIEDNTAALAEIIIHLAPGVSPDKTIDALYAFTDCELSISPNASVIDGDRPRFIGVSEILKINTNNTVDLLRRELEIRMDELQRQWHFSTLEKIFINEEMYIDFKHYSDRESLYEYLYKRFEPFKKQLIREIVDEDLQKLTQIPMIRITRFDASKADELIAKIEAEMEEIKRNLENLIEYAIEYYKDLKKRFGEGRERKTEIKTFDSINATKVIIANKKLYVDYDEGFIGHGLKKAEYIADCSEIDDVIIFFATGKMMVTKVSDKKFVGKGIVYANVWKKGDKRTIYHMMYQDGVGGPTMMKRFTVDSITRDTEYDLTRGTKGSKLLYFSVHPNGEREIVTVMLRPRPHIKRLRFDIDFGALLIKGRSAAGNRVTKEIVQKIVQKEVGGSTLAARKIWYDEIVGRLNDDGRGKFLGQFKGNDKILTLYKSGEYRLSGFDLATHFDEDMIHIEKWHPDRPISAVYYDAEKDLHFVKRFLCEVTMDKKVLFISESEGSHLDLASTAYRPKARIVYNKLLKATKNLADTIIDIADFIDIKGMKAQGNQLTKLKIKEVLPEIPEGGEEPWPEEQAVEPVIDAESDTTVDTDEGESPTMEWDMTNDDDQPKLF
ncbi:DNA gyrase/topoisomerase IV subunit A [Crocinitomicaceae bacterium CZZ-1]|uniref:DNA gyrase/topoisomerase IV subunit A n=1 Tax=Taishania pollutisoli TaxID=2766479 RepID=A0A8J6PNL0_9FLAO|nr:DNA gyrase/topoisomerase IV subunit A [Taishania pollutisoli]MBC9811718.1 DNA gyrase/topoisomerase IV subunit A [Taishania pollutisoli]